MNYAALSNYLAFDSLSKIKRVNYLFLFFIGLVGPLGFAPFHLPVITLIAVAFLYGSLINSDAKQSFIQGFIFGLGYFGLGVSWVLISIHDFGELNYFFAGMITLLFIAYLALFPALVSYLFYQLKSSKLQLLNIMLFASLWVLSEWLRAHLFTGFPWLLLGTAQIDTPLHYIAPIIGTTGLSICCAVAAASLATAFYVRSRKRIIYISLLFSLLLVPFLFKNMQWTSINKTPVSIGLIQANLAMRDKWDEALFWNLLKYYQDETAKLLGKQLIILPESAIPLPSSYLDDYLQKLHNKALAANSALILGILQPTNANETHYYNSIISLGRASGTHSKRHLVPFGEYIPQPFVAINRWLGLPEPNVLPGTHDQPLMEIANHPIASLICYEIAYPALLRAQMPTAEWIVSISDNGWFGRSLASYQQLQMAQMLSLTTGRYQIVVNNDGLSSVINQYGAIVDGLAPFSSGILESEVFSAEGTTPWIKWADYPSLAFCALILIFALIRRISSLRKK